MSEKNAKTASVLQKDPVMAGLMKKYPHIEKEWKKSKKEKRDVFEAIARTIVGQQLSVKAARTIWGRVEELVGKMTPENILKISDEKYRNAGMSWAKASYVLSLAKAVKEKEFLPEDLHDLEDDQVRHKLVELKGIGPWSAEMILLFTLKRPDIFSIGDMGLRNAISKRYSVDKNDFEKMLKINFFTIF